MRQSFVLGMFAAALSLGVFTGLARSADPVAPMSSPSSGSYPTVPQPMPPGSTLYEGGVGSVYDTLPPEPLLPVGKPRKWPWGCWATVNSMGCGSLHADGRFIFGSCRAFYGEPCIKAAPGSPRANAYQEGACGCR